MYAFQASWVLLDTSVEGDCLCYWFVLFLPVTTGLLCESSVKHGDCTVQAQAPEICAPYVLTYRDFSGVRRPWRSKRGWQAIKPCDRTSITLWFTVNHKVRRSWFGPEAKVDWRATSARPSKSNHRLSVLIVCASILLKAKLIKSINSPDPSARLHLLLLLKD